MAIKVAEFNRRIDRLIATLPGKLLNSLERVGLDMKADINHRIVTTGKDKKGQPFRPYTPGYLQFKEDVGRYRGFVDFQLGNYSINKRIAAVEARKRKRGVRRLSSEERNAVKLQRRTKATPESGTLWRNVGIIEKVNRQRILLVTIGARDDKNKKKLQGLAIKRGNILAPTNPEKLTAAKNLLIDYKVIVKQTIGI